MKTINLNSKLRSKKSILAAASALGFTNLEIKKARFGRCFTSKTGKQYIYKYFWNFEGKEFATLRNRHEKMEDSMVMENIKPDMKWQVLKDLSWEERTEIVKKELGPEWRSHGCGLHGSEVVITATNDKTEKRHITQFGEWNYLDEDGEKAWKIFWDIIRRSYATKLAREQELEPHSCGKCRGTGFIPQFAWYADGICFDCLGAGSFINNKIVEVKL